MYWWPWLLPPATKLGQGNIFRSVCQQFCPQGGHAWLLGGHAWFYLGGACMVLFRGHAWFYLGGMHGFILGGLCGFIWGGAGVVLFRGGVHGFFSFFGYNEIWSMSGRYASYWNAFLFAVQSAAFTGTSSKICSIFGVTRKFPVNHNFTWLSVHVRNWIIFCTWKFIVCSWTVKYSCK